MSQPLLVLVTAITPLLLSAGNWIIIFGRIISAFTIHYYYCMFKLYTKLSKPIKQHVVIIILNIIVLKLIYYYQLIPKTVLLLILSVKIITIYYYDLKLFLSTSKKKKKSREHMNIMIKVLHYLFHTKFARKRSILSIANKHNCNVVRVGSKLFLLF